MLKKLLKYTEIKVDEQKGQVTAILNTRNITAKEIRFCTCSDGQSKAMAEQLIRKKPIFVGKARLKPGDTKDTGMAVKIAKTKLERQFDKYMIQVLVGAAKDLLLMAEGCFKEACKISEDVDNCTFHIIDLQLPKDIGPVDIDISGSRSATAKKLLFNPSFSRFVRAVEMQKEDKIAYKARCKENKKKNSDPNTAD
jgi:hypothetical protein